MAVGETDRVRAEVLAAHPDWKGTFQPAVMVGRKEIRTLIAVL